ncbi:MAG: insulinase family protein [Acetatifactor sp.]|nr:insulinase family protein [Acetatifactor sp.]
MNIVSSPRNEFQTIGIGAWFERGSFYDPEGLEGLHHLIEHLFFNARGVAQRVERLKEKGIIINAFTSQEVACFYAMCLKDTYEETKDLMQYLMLENVFAEGLEGFENEKEIVRKEIRYHYNYAEILKERLLSQMFPDDCRRFAIMGSELSVDQIKECDIIKAYELFSRSRSFLTVVGAVPSCGQTVLEDPLEKRTCEVPRLGDGFHVIGEGEGEYCFYGIGHFFDNRDRNFSQIFHTYVREALQKELREKEQMIYRIDTASINISYGTVLFWMFKCPRVQLERVDRAVGKALNGEMDLATFQALEQKEYVKSIIKNDNVKSTMLHLGYENTIMRHDVTEKEPIQSALLRLKENGRFYRCVI